MQVSSVKNLNGETFSAIQDATLTDVVQTNSGNWQDITAYQNASAGYLTAHQDLSEYYTTADANTMSGMLSGAIDYVSANAGDEFPASANEAITAYQNASGTYLTAVSIPESGDWSESTNYVQTNSGAIDETVSTVGTNSGVWGGSALPVSAGPGIKVNLVDNTLLFSNDETVLWSGTAAPSNFPLTMSEPFSLFEKIEFVWNPRYNGDYGCPTYCTQLGTEKYGASVPTKYTLVGEYANANQIWKEYWYLENDNNGATLSSYKALYWPGTGGTNSATQTNCRLFKVVGINRIAGGN